MNATLDEQSRYDRFVAGLTALTREHGIALNVCGGVCIARDARDFAALSYRADIGSSDLCPNWPED
jgi:hypothetical protein